MEKVTDVDWVSELHAWQPDEVIKSLAGRVEADLANRSKQRGDEALRFERTGPRGFRVWNGYSGHSYLFEALDRGIGVSHRISGEIQGDRRVANVLIDDDGVRRLSFGDRDLLPWQFLRAVLEPLFFPRA